MFATNVGGPAWRWRAMTRSGSRPITGEYLSASVVAALVSAAGVVAAAARAPSVSNAHSVRAAASENRLRKGMRLGLVDMS